MKSSTKFWLGIFTFLPLVFVILFLCLFFTVFFGQIIELEHSRGEFPLEFIPSIFGFIVLIIIAGMISLGIKIYYIVHTNNKSENDSNKKIMWTLVLIFGGTVAAIVYYFIEIIPLKLEN